MKRIILIILAFVILHGSPSFPEKPASAQNIYSTIYTLKVEIEIEEKAIEKLRREYSGLVNKRSDIFRQIVLLYNDLDNYVKDGLNEENLSGIEDKEQNIDRLENENNSLRIKGQLVRAELTDKLARVATLKQKTEELKRSLPSMENSVNGSWSFTMMPNRITGTVVLFQQGTVITGEYSFEGGWTGSFTGHIANRRVVLERIDSKLGRVGTYIAALSDDGKTLSGSWENYELSRAPIAGSWSAIRLDQ